MTIWLLLVPAVLISAYTKDRQYECGEHGRFEYCIDGIPGCIIGCHCHPGHYFDTDTKICEPNTKLLESYRRQYMAEPTRIPVSQIDYPEIIEHSTYFPTTSALDDHVDNIARNAEDLGDWLYNQFYKTIETEVINNTNGNVITRRNGKGGEIRAKKRRRKNDKTALMKKKLKQDDLRRRLLRITEDDSLFDSDTDDDSSDTSSSKEQHESNDKEHGHKKFVILNKKPKPPLPSFVFLPNIETPFYPPVGLPPPVLPMYPMVPVPPVLPPAYPFPNISPDCEEKETTTKTFSSSLSSLLPEITAVPSESATTESTLLHESDTTSDTISTTDSSLPADLRSNKRQKKYMRQGEIDVLRRLRQLIQKSGLKQKPQKILAPPVSNLDRESLDIQETLQIEPVNTENFRLQIDNKPPQDDKITDLKYLSQLIHRVNPNDTGKIGMRRMTSNIIRKPLIINQKTDRIPKIVPKVVEPSRRFNLQMYPQELSTPDDSFYSNLGKQIATLIRGVDSKNNKQINIEIEHLDHNTPNYPLFSELSYAPRSYWERYARSPKNYLEQYRRRNEHIKKSNEMLYKIENEVVIAASTMAPMSLLEIENFIKRIPESEDEIEESEPQNYQSSSNSTINIKLRPDGRPKVNFVTNQAKPIAIKSQQYLNSTKTEMLENNFHTKPIRIQNIFNTWVDTVNNISNKKKKNIKMNKTSDDINKKLFKPNIEKPITKDKQFKKPNYGNNSMTLFNPVPTRRSNIGTVHHQPLSLFEYNKKFLNLNVNNQYPFYKKKDFKFRTVEKPVNRRVSKIDSSSYFHHLGHRFNYLD